MVSTLKSDNFVELCGYCVEGNTRVLAYEFATMGSLHDILHGRKGVQGAQPDPVFDWMQRVRIAVDAAKGLDMAIGRFGEDAKHTIWKFNSGLLTIWGGRRLLCSDRLG